MGATNRKLNERQWAVLRWISEGCPDREWPDSTHKTTAVALQSRRLVQISRSGGVWSAELTDGGRHFLNADGQGDVVKPPPAFSVRDKRPKQSAAAEWSEKAASSASKSVLGGSIRAGQPYAAPPLSPTRTLLRDIEQADGELHRNVNDDKTNYQALVAIINRRDMAPEGMRVVTEQGDSYTRRIFRLEAKPEWKTVPTRDVVAAGRIPRWNKVVADLRDKKSIGMTSEVATRAIRILQSLASEAEARGHSVEIPRVHTDRNGFEHREDRGQLVIRVRDHRFAVWLIQREDHSPHTATAEELKQKAERSWTLIPKWDKTPGRRLQLRLYKPGHRGWHEDWNDTKTFSVRIEDHLPELMHQIEKTADNIDARAEAERDELARVQDRRSRAEQLVGRRHAEAVRERFLLERARQWEQWRQVRGYVEELTRQVEGSESALAEADDWLEWSRSYLRRADPFSQPVTMPVIPIPTWEEKSKLMDQILANEIP